MSHKYTWPRNKREAIHMIRNPCGPDSPYDFVKPENLTGFLNEDVDARSYSIVSELRTIVNKVLSGMPLKAVKTNRERLSEMEDKIMEMIAPFDGHLSTIGLMGLKTFCVGILRTKYY